MIKQDETLVGGPLPDNIKILMRYLLSATDEPMEISELQIEQTVVQSFAPDWIDLSTPLSVPQFNSDKNPFLGDIIVYRDGEPTDFIYLWCEERRLSAIEQAWVTDEPPEDWLTPEIVRFERISKK